MGYSKETNIASRTEPVEPDQHVKVIIIRNAPEIPTPRRARHYSTEAMNSATWAWGAESLSKTLRPPVSPGLCPTYKPSVDFRKPQRCTKNEAHTTNESEAGTLFSERSGSRGIYARHAGRNSQGPPKSQARKPSTSSESRNEDVLMETTRGPCHQVGSGWDNHLGLAT